MPKKSNLRSDPILISSSKDQSFRQNDTLFFYVLVFLQLFGCIFFPYQIEWLLFHLNLRS
ncbi:MAG: hypothetical protein A3D96_03010 [Chlamydiae bacterium RIFCSPHIGHO2_12_FULL_44_59]|nr:MAG: hypothetical protein A2796_01300 [Chlamydiae bacterium RIFCSPHIGHO2_01_FULL_44_39]OGN57388.1 MAG: hypothetical protein A3C42_03530 [Chlamydiae bacterium RIFCSPHIGHO2_02_FULL_45_9]OGN60954.1 MAG: hypothetical protein A3D96_03010 [Chlamydiae bacterium RIFCSPHIGHO2_12_FULL_44_59]OGN66642.1 MAG: hypothetical protein A2978_01510 [Chlamydiae bacterium RIFCSPLOWO2_01_FULL_44_52]OGN69646.1 MAG: hypothetical protein A3I67_06410 [Chlamydiae bacterium RIFCSPLOWO2_02_FULL_45_22]OGN70886.1 MAG: hyp